MKIHTFSKLNQRKKADVLLVPLYKKGKTLEWPKEVSSLEKTLSLPITSGDFEGKEGEVTLLYSKEGVEPRILLLGLGEDKKLTKEKIRRSMSQAHKQALKLKAKTLNVILPEVAELNENEILEGALEGLLLTNYKFTKLKGTSLKKDDGGLVEEISLLTHNKKAQEKADKLVAIAESVYAVRDLVNGNADDVTPQYLAQFAKEMAKKDSKIKTTVLGKKEIEKEKMGLILAVNRGSFRDPHLIISEYRGNPSSKKKLVLVGKGVTYDTGGLNLKPTGSMETMKCDMGGAATVLATLALIAKLKLKVNVTALVPTTENSMDALSYKPGDVYKSYSGKTVEVNNTDAEGRLILADALTYAVKKLKATEIIDLATLTGAIDIALGSEAIGLFSNNDDLAEGLEAAGKETYERVWRMPMFDEYRDALRSDIADMKNTGGRSGGAITAAHFLQDYVEDLPWAHLDIASVAYLNEPKRYHPKHGTGIGVRLLLNYIENQK